MVASSFQDPNTDLTTPEREMPAPLNMGLQDPVSQEAELVHMWEGSWKNNKEKNSL